MHRITAVKIAVFSLLALPFIWLLYGLLTNNLGTNPIEKLTHETGKWALICLILSLCSTPLKILFGFKWALKFRRMLGIFCFFYASLHLLTYWIFDQSLSLLYVWEDIRDRPYITLGFSAWLILLPLAVTSTNGWRKRLARKWVSLHKFVYAAALLALGHYVWLIRADYAEVVIYGVAITTLLGYRLARFGKRQTGLK